jgi:hypothetical protein
MLAKAAADPAFADFQPPPAAPSPAHVMVCADPIHTVTGDHKRQHEMLTNLQIKRAAAVVIALSAITAPAASARFDPNDATGTASATPVVRPNPDQQLSPAATLNAGPRSEVVSGGGYGSPSMAPTIVRVTTPDRGFDWGDAGIGAAGGISLSVLGVGGTLAVSSRRSRRSKQAAAVTS